MYCVELYAAVRLSVVDEGLRHIGSLMMPLA